MAAKNKPNAQLDNEAIHGKGCGTKIRKIKNELISLFVDRKTTIRPTVGRIGESICAIDGAERQQGMEK
jgi:hypothetical protein